MQYSYGNHITQRNVMPSYRVLQAQHTHTSNINTLKERIAKENRPNQKPYLVNSKEFFFFFTWKRNKLNERKTKKEEKAKGEPRLRRKGTTQHHRRGAKRAETWRGWVKWWEPAIGKAMASQGVFVRRRLRNQHRRVEVFWVQADTHTFRISAREAFRS